MVVVEAHSLVSFQARGILYVSLTLREPQMWGENEVEGMIIEEEIRTMNLKSRKKSLTSNRRLSSESVLSPSFASMRLVGDQ